MQEQTQETKEKINLEAALFKWTKLYGEVASAAKVFASAQEELRVYEKNATNRLVYDLEKGQSTGDSFTDALIRYFGVNANAHKATKEFNQMLISSKGKEMLILVPYMTHRRSDNRIFSQENFMEKRVGQIFGILSGEDMDLYGDRSNPTLFMPFEKCVMMGVIDQNEIGTKGKKVLIVNGPQIPLATKIIELFGRVNPADESGMSAVALFGNTLTDEHSKHLFEGCGVLPTTVLRNRLKELR